MLVTVAGALAAPPFTSRIADRYIAPTDEAVETRVYVLTHYGGGPAGCGRTAGSTCTLPQLRAQLASEAR